MKVRVLVWAFLLLPFLAVADEPCRPELWAHMRNPNRLQTVTCITVRGVVGGRLPNPYDGDWHVNILLEPEFASLLNKANIKKNGGMLVTEFICSAWPGRNRSYCKGYRNDLALPRRGDLVKIMGVLTVDLVHGWMEINPVSEVVILKKKGRKNAEGPGLKPGPFSYLLPKRGRSAVTTEAYSRPKAIIPPMRRAMQRMWSPWFCLIYTTLQNQINLAKNLRAGG